MGLGQAMGDEWTAERKKQEEAKLKQTNRIRLMVVTGGINLVHVHKSRLAFKMVFNLGEVCSNQSETVSQLLDLVTQIHYSILICVRALTCTCPATETHFLFNNVSYISFRCEQE